jgi:hypothetical protein
MFACLSGSKRIDLINWSKYLCNKVMKIYKRYVTDHTSELWILIFIYCSQVTALQEPCAGQLSISKTIFFCSKLCTIDQFSNYTSMFLAYYKCKSNETRCVLWIIVILSFRPLSSMERTIYNIYIAMINRHIYNNLLYYCLDSLYHQYKTEM